MASQGTDGTLLNAKINFYFNGEALRVHDKPGIPFPAGAFCSWHCKQSSAWFFHLGESCCTCQGFYPQVRLTSKKLLLRVVKGSVSSNWRNKMGWPWPTFCTVAPKTPVASTHFQYATLVSNETLSIRGMGWLCGTFLWTTSATRSELSIGIYIVRWAEHGRFMIGSRSSERPPWILELTVRKKRYNYHFPLFCNTVSIMSLMCRSSPFGECDDLGISDESTQWNPIKIVPNPRSSHLGCSILSSVRQLSFFQSLMDDETNPKNNWLVCWSYQFGE